MFTTELMSIQIQFFNFLFKFAMNNLQVLNMVIFHLMVFNSVITHSPHIQLYVHLFESTIY